jgi:homospermidine synthase
MVIFQYDMSLNMRYNNIIIMKLKDTTTVVIRRSTRRIISHIKYQLDADNYDEVILKMAENYVGSSKYDNILKFLGIPKK